jgi:hypothetical protein
VSRWTLASTHDNTATFQVTLPLAGLSLTRALRLHEYQVRASASLLL